MVRYLFDVIFSIVILVGICYGFLFTGQIGFGEFCIALILGYVGARFLLVTDFICELLETKFESVEIKETNE